MWVRGKKSASHLQSIDLKAIKAVRGVHAKRRKRELRSDALRKQTAHEVRSGLELVRHRHLGGRGNDHRE